MSQATAEPPERPEGAAQHRVDRIQAFHAELAEVESEIGPLLDGAGRERLTAHHASLLGRLKGDFDIDATEAERQVSLGMRVASLLGAFAFCAAVFLFFYRHWGRIPFPVQIGLLALGPVLSLALTDIAARRERNRYFAWLAGLVACASFVLALEAAGRILSLPHSPWRYLAWAGFGAVLAWSYRFRLVLAAAVVSFSIFLLGSLTALTGAWWVGFLSRPEGIAASGVGWVALTVLRPQLLAPDFAATVRLTGAIMAFLALFVLGIDGNLSLIPFDGEAVEAVYDVLALALAGVGIWLGIQRGWTELRLVSTAFAVLLLIVKAFDWWWDWLPRELFFLALGLLAVGIMVALRRYRARLA
jgi:uncharacterized membrane protein